MQDKYKTKKQLIEELASLRKKVTQLENGQNGTAKKATQTGSTEVLIDQSALDMLPQNIIIKDKNLRYTFGNKVYLQTLGLSLEEIIGKTNEDIHPPELAKKFTEDDKLILKTGKIIDTVESRVSPVSKETVYTQVIKGPVRDEDNEINGVQVVFWDVTERVKAEQTLIQERNLLQILINNTTDLIYVKNNEGKFLLANMAQARYLGKDSPDELVGKDDFDFYPKELAEQYWADEKEIAETGEALIDHEEININYETGQQTWTSATKVPFKDKDGNVEGWVGISRDITAKKQAEVEIAKRATELETVAQVGMAASTILDVDELLQQVTDLTKKSFGLYHAHIYLLDEFSNTLTLTAGAGEVGRKMVAQGWSIPFNKEDSLVARAARTRQGVIENDVRNAPDWLPNPLLPDTYAELAVPMMIGDKVLGVFDVQSNTVGHFTEEDINIQTTLAAQVGVALQNAKLFQQTQQSGKLLHKRVSELNVMTELGREIANAPPIDDLLNWVTKRISPAMQYPEICKVAIEYKEQIYGDSEAVTLPHQMVHALRIENEIVGHIYIAYTQKHDFLNEESALLGGTANRLSSYIESRNLFEQIQTTLGQTEDQANRLALLNEMNQEMNLVKNQDEIFKIAARYTSSIIHSQRSSIALLTPNGNNLEVLALQGEKGAIPTGTQLPVEGTSIGISVREKRMVSTADTLTTTSLDTRKLAEQGLRSTITVPLIVGEQVIGTLNVGSKQVNAYTRQDENLLLQTASMVASTIENQRLVEQAQQRASELEENTNFLNSIIDNIPSGLFVKDAKDLRIVQWNKANEDIHGLKAEDLLGKTDYDLFTKEEADFFVNTDRSVLAGRELVDIPEESVDTPHRGIRFLHTKKIPVFGADGQPRFLLGISEDITESKQAEEALARERDLLQTLMDNSPDHIFFRDTESRFIRTNNSHAQKLLGLNSAEEAIGKTDFDLFIKEDAQKFYDEEQEIMRTGKAVYNREGKVPTIEGTVHWLSEHKIPIKDETGKVTGLLGIARDITQRKEAEAERERAAARLTEERGLLRTLIDTLPDFVYVKDKAGKFLLANQALAQLMNVESPEYLVGKSDADFYPPELANQYLADEQTLMNAGEALLDHEEPNMDQKTGEQTWTSTTKVPFRDTQGQVIGLVGVSRDITESKNAGVEREQLLVQVQQLATIVENHPDFIGVGTMEGQAVYVNPAGLSMIGLPPDYDVSSMAAEDFYPSEYAKQVVEVGLPAALEQGSWSAEAMLQKADGTTVPVEQTLAINYDSSGNPSSFSITMRDNTERKAADAERERLLEEVEATYRQYIRGEWEQHLRDEHGGRWNVEYRQPGTAPTLPTNGNDTAKIETPIALRGQQIGKLNLEDIDPNRKWTSEEMALVETVSEQLAQTIENLRLFGDTQQRATREQLTRQIADKMRAAPDVDTIVQTGLGELAKVLGVSRTYLKLNTEFEQDE